MISIIVSSRSINQFETLSKNIQQTVGVAYEIIRIENSNGALSICTAYNNGAAQAKFSYLSFVHEDVLFITQNWGHQIINHFEQEKDAGLLGVAGGVYKKRMVSGWAEFENDTRDIRRVNIIQHYKFSGKQKEHILINPAGKSSSEVVALDGVFLCTKKVTWNENKFDEKLLKGFHGYDLDFSLQIGRTKKMFVIYDVLLEHFSEGNCDLGWYADMIAVHQKWKNILPVGVDFSIADDIDIYNCDWNKLRYVMGLFIKGGYKYFALLKVYNSLFTLVNYAGKKHAIIKDYFLQWAHISKRFLLSR